MKHALTIAEWTGEDKYHCPIHNYQFRCPVCDREAFFNMNVLGKERFIVCDGARFLRVNRVRIDADTLASKEESLEAYKNDARSRDTHVVMFSGGKDSTAMLLMMVERKMPIDRIVFIDTTKEFPATYAHIAKVKALIAPLEIDVITIPFDYYFATHIKQNGTREGERGYGWPDFRNRWCTRLKINASRSYLRGLGDRNIIEYHGIAADEDLRADKNEDWRTIRYPLRELGVSGKQALEYCRGRGLDWNGHYEEFSRASCFCCPLRGIAELRTIYQNHKWLWDRLKTMDAKQRRRFKHYYSIQELEDRFKEENSLFAQEWAEEDALV